MAQIIVRYHKDYVTFVESRIQADNYAFYRMFACVNQFNLTFFTKKKFMYNKNTALKLFFYNDFITSIESSTTSITGIIHCQFSTFKQLFLTKAYY